MDNPQVAQVAIVDYGMGNLFSVQQACRWAGLEAAITSSPTIILAAKAIILPGVGAFGVAMDNLVRLDLVGALHFSFGCRARSVTHKQLARINTYSSRDFGSGKGGV